MKSRPVYLDNQATTPMDPAVREAMWPYLTEQFGNPHSNAHRFGWVASEATRDARAQVAGLINADDDEIVFTSGATESCNLALRGVANRAGNGRRDRIVTLATEHPAVLETVHDLGRAGHDAIILPVERDGLLELDKLECALDERTLIVSVMAVNNEIGVLQPLADIAARCHAAGALFHTDATQAAGRLPIDVDDWNVDLLSLSSHKVYGPKGIGALYVRSGVQLRPIITGGSQERGLRGGTLPTALIVGFGAACELASEKQDEDRSRMQALSARLYRDLREAHPHLRLFGHERHRVAGNLNIGFPGISAEEVIRSGRREYRRLEWLGMLFGNVRAVESASCARSRRRHRRHRVSNQPRALYHRSRHRDGYRSALQHRLTSSMSLIAMPQTRPDLLFGPGTNDGFTSTGMATFDNLRPAAVVRELIQNALDAAHQARTLPARVRFQLTRTRKGTLPGITAYEKAFAKAIEAQRNLTGGSLATQAELVVARIQSALDSEEVDVLTVLDNGVGLNEERMNALLSDGLSVKEGDATGTYGNGHSTAIPASDLRYVLYAGITADGKRIGSGHAVLASHRERSRQHMRSGHGFFIRGFHAGDGKLFVYSRGPGLSGLISNALRQVKAHSTHGTAVIIPAFNNFLEDDSLWEMVSHGGVRKLLCRNRRETT